MSTKMNWKAASATIVIAAKALEGDYKAKREYCIEQLQLLKRGNGKAIGREEAAACFNMHIKGVLQPAAPAEEVKTEEAAPAGDAAAAEVKQTEVPAVTKVIIARTIAGGKLETQEFDTAEEAAAAVKKLNKGVKEVLDRWSVQQ